jgi:rubrerythrin
MQNELSSMLYAVVRNQALHAKWLNTFSYLEYIGFRKIVKSQKMEEITGEVLEHAIEEGRHALLLKRIALKIGGSEFNSYRETTLFCPNEAEAYFQGLDQTCENKLSYESNDGLRAKLIYLYVTLLVEERALEVYSVYQKVLAEADQKLPLNGLLAEEERHLASVQASLRLYDPNFERHFSELKAVENKLSQKFLTALDLDLKRTRSDFEVFA